MSSFVSIFLDEDDRYQLYELVDDFMEDREFVHWKTKYVDDSKLEEETRVDVNYNILYSPTPYNLKYIIREYLDHVKILKNLRGLKTPLTTEEQAILNKFFEMNDWANLFKNMIRNRKLYGDVFVPIRLKKIDNTYIPLLKILHPGNIEISINKKTEDYEYVYKKIEEIPIRMENSLTIQHEQKTIELLFRKGAIIPFVNSYIEEDKIFLMPEEFKDYTPMIHLQFLKKPDSLYSEIPSLDFVDSILRLHRIETNISETNDKSGAPQMVAIDGIFDPRSKFGARSIAYCDTTTAARQAQKQAQVIVFEIKNGLESLFTERDMVSEALFSSANLIPPSLKEIFAKSDSSKVIKFLNMDLLQELRTAYEEISESTKIIWKILFPHRVDEDIALEIPLEIENSSLMDKASYVSAKIMLIKDILKDQGRTDEEVQQYMDDLMKQTAILESKGISAVAVPTIEPDAPQNDVKDNASTEGVDNKLKN